MNAKTVEARSSVAGQNAESAPVDANAPASVLGSVPESEEVRPVKNPYRHRGFWVRSRIRLTMLGVLVLPFVSWQFGDAQMARWSVGPGIVLTLLGVVLRLWAAGWLHKGTELATCGPYALARHPLYLGTGLIALGHSLLSALPSAPVLFPLLWLTLYLPAMRDEETFLEGEFGARYANYKTQTGALWPRPAGLRNVMAGGFSWRQAKRNREYEAAILNAALVGVYLWLHARR